MIFLVGTVSSISIDIDVENSFSTGEMISFDYTISSAVGKTITYIVHVDCPSAPLALLNPETISLQAGVDFTENYIFMSEIGEDIEPQTCNAIVSITSPEEVLEEENFEIVALPGFDFEILLCKDESCAEQSNMFIKNQEVYLSYNSDLQDISVFGVLVYPDEEVKQIVFPNSIIANQAGTYDLQVFVNKQGYKQEKEIVQFGVIKQDAEIEGQDFSVGSSVPGFIGKNKGMLIYSILGALFLISLIVILILRRKRRL